MSVKLACLIRPTDTIIQQQHLFTVYVHPSKSFEGATGLREALSGLTIALVVHMRPTWHHVCLAGQSLSALDRRL